MEMEHGHDRGTRALPAVFVLFLFSFRWRSCRAGRSAMTRAVNLDGHRVSTPDVYLLRWRMRRRRSFKRFMRFLCHFGRIPRGRLTVPMMKLQKVEKETPFFFVCDVRVLKENGEKG